MYAHPQLKRLSPGATVYHKHLPGVPLVVVSGPEKAVRGERYTVQMPDGKVVPVKKKNLEG